MTSHRGSPHRIYKCIKSVRNNLLPTVSVHLSYGLIEGCWKYHGHPKYFNFLIWMMVNRRFFILIFDRSINRSFVSMQTTLLNRVNGKRGRWRPRTSLDIKHQRVDREELHRGCLFDKQQIWLEDHCTQPSWRGRGWWWWSISAADLIHQMDALTKTCLCVALTTRMGVMQQAWSDDRQAVFHEAFRRSTNWSWTIFKFYW